MVQHDRLSVKLSCRCDMYYGVADVCCFVIAEMLDPIKESHVEFLHSRSKLTEALGTSPQVGSSS